MKWENVMRFVSPKSWWVTGLITAVLMAFIMLYGGFQKYTAQEVSTGHPVSKSARNEIEEWNTASSRYKDRTGNTLTSSQVTSEIKDDDLTNVTGKLTLTQIDKNVDRALDMRYAVTGKVTERVRTSSKFPNYVSLKVGIKHVRVYYYDLPYQVSGDKVKVTGLIIGEDKKGTLLMISSAKNTVDTK